MPVTFSYNKVIVCLYSSLLLIKLFKCIDYLKVNRIGQGNLCYKKTQQFNSQKWSTCNFSLKYQYIIQQKGTENSQTY